ncbi:MAG: DUF2914 domain-containing protein [Nitrospira sp.]|nr:DUF2914 domain-containing protein [Nitrospira sp.]
MRPPSTIQVICSKPFMPVVWFVAGVIYDSLTLTRIDRLQDNLVLLLYLTLLGVLVVLIGRFGVGPAPDPASLALLSPLGRWLLKGRPYYPMASQFLLGGLFSAYAIFYSRSVTLTGTAIFFTLLIVLLVGNEVLRHRLSNLWLLVTLYAIVSFAFFTFFLPVVTGVMNPSIFLLGAALSVAVVFCVVHLVYRHNRERPMREAVGITASACAVIGLLVGLYFLNWIPPVPLSLKFGGIYHHVKKKGDRFELSFDQRWYQFWKRSDDTMPADEPVYCFTAVFAPVDLHTTIYHHWFHRARSGMPFVHVDKIPIKISGGRDAGYRAYTVKQRLDSGDWRVDVEAEDGRIIGRIVVTVVARANEPSVLRTIMY